VIGIIKESINLPKTATVGKAGIIVMAIQSDI
jgi:hypothetical protein